MLREEGGGGGNTTKELPQGILLKETIDEATVGDETISSKVKMESYQGQVLLCDILLLHLTRNG